MRSRWVILGFVGGAIAGALVGLAVWVALRLAGWPLVISSGSFELLRWGGVGALTGGIAGAIFYPQIPYAATHFSDSAIRAAPGGSTLLTLLGGWTGVLILGAFFGAWIGGVAGGICGASYAPWDDSTGYTGCVGFLSGAVVGIPAGLVISALLGMMASASCRK